MSDNDEYEFGCSIHHQSWNPIADVPRDKVHDTESRRFRILEFSEPFVESNWCEKGHAGYVLAGEFIINVDDKLVTFRAGDTIDLPAGVKHRHHATIESTTVFLIEIGSSRA